MEFRIGDVVVLKSGSPKMTVTDQEETNVPVIFWNPIKGIFERMNFENGLLEKSN